MSGLRIACAIVGAASAWVAASAGAQPPCDSGSIVAGDVEVSSAVLGSLSTAARASACAGAELSVRRTAYGYELRLVKDGREVSREVATIDDAVVWAESWLTGDADISGSPTEGVASGASNAARVPIEPAASAVTAQAPAHSAPDDVLASADTPATWQLGVALDGAIDRWGAWLGPEIFAAWDVSAVVWLGFDLGGGWALDEAEQGVEIERSILRAAARGGVSVGLGPGSLRLGLGVGVAGLAVSRTDAAGQLSEEETGVFLAGGAAYAVRVAGPLVISLGVGARWHVPEIGAEAEDLEEMRLFRIPEVLGNAHVGVAWMFGGAP